MLLLWDVYWPLAAAALLVGLVAGVLAYRPGTPRRKRLMCHLGGLVAVLAAAVAWHGPAGAADRFRGKVEQTVRTTLVYYEMAHVEADLSGPPLGRALVLEGTADDFQRSELVRILSSAPGVSTARWAGRESGCELELPVLAEVSVYALVAFGLGLLLAYLFELRRRARAEWRW